MFLYLLLFQLLMQSDPLADYRWKNRLVIVASSDLKDSDVTKQLAAFDFREAEVEERAMKILSLQAFNEEEKNYLRRKFNLEDNLTVLLVGKDGGVKLKEEKYVDPQKIFDLIDSMPMRQAEMRRKNNDH